MSQNTGSVAVLIPAAGEGTRLGGRRKQFRRLGGEPLLVQTLRVFERHAEIAHILVAVPLQATKALAAELRRVGLSKLWAVVAGGATRQESVRAALNAVPADVSVVLVHDAVRPFVQADHLSAVIRAVRTDGAAALALPVVDTMRYGVASHFKETISRDSLYRMQTPQGFRRDWFEEAHGLADREDLHGTDDVELVQRLGCAVHIVEGSPRNIKITTPEDWELAQLLWPHWEASLVH